MTEQDNTPAIDLDDTEGHGRPHGREDEDDTEGHGRPHGREDEDDTEGHGRPHGREDEDDTEGHGRPHGREDEATSGEDAPIEGARRGGGRLAVPPPRRVGGRDHMETDCLRNSLVRARTCA
jgi:hypothetical protein